jgi:hypothetical protein
MCSLCVCVCVCECVCDVYIGYDWADHDVASYSGVPAAPAPSRSEDSARNMFNMVSRAHATLGLPGVRARARPSTAGPAPARQAPIAVPAQQRSKNSPPSRLSEQLAADPTGQAVQVRPLGALDWFLEDLFVCNLGA